MILGFMRLHNYPTHHREIIESLAAACDVMMFFRTSKAHPRFLELVSGHPKTLDVFEAPLWVGNNTSLDKCFTYVDMIAPDFVVYPDHDELLPVQTREMVESIDEMGCDGICFPMLMTVGSPDTILIPNNMPPHVKALKWRKGYWFYRGNHKEHPPTMCAPQNPGMVYYHSPYPVRHLCVMTKDIRGVRDKEVNDGRILTPRRKSKGVFYGSMRQFIDDGKHIEFPYDNDTTWFDYRKAVPYKYEAYTVCYASLTLPTIGDWKPRFDKLKAHCCFAGFPWSGARLLGAMLNTSPNVLLADGYRLHVKTLGERHPYDVIRAQMVRHARWNFVQENECCRPSQDLPSFPLHSPLHDKTDADIRLFGSVNVKDTERLVKDLRTKKKTFSESSRLYGKTFSPPLSIVYVLRNPFDVVANICMALSEVEGKPAGEFFKRAFGEVLSSLRERKTLRKFGADVVVVYYEDILDKPRRVVRGVLSAFGIDPDKESLVESERLVAPGKHDSRNRLKWPEKWREKVRKMIRSRPILHRYVGESWEPEDAK